MKRRIYLTAWRILLALLIVANMTVIFLLSSENGTTSNRTGTKISEKIAESVVENFENQTEREQEKALVRLQHPWRKLGHLLEFGALGAWIFLLLLTWRGRIWLRYLISLGATTLYAVTDECHQLLVAGRGASVWDVLLDTSGALITCTALFLFAMAFERWRKRRTHE